MKKLILMTMITLSISSAFAADPKPKSASKTRYGEADTTCSAGDDSHRGAKKDTTPPKTDKTSTSGTDAIDG